METRQGLDRKEIWDEIYLLLILTFWFKDKKLILTDFFQSTKDQNIAVEKKSVIIQLLSDDKAFRVSPAVDSVTSEISSIQKVVEFQIQHLEIFKKKMA